MALLWRYYQTTHNKFEPWSACAEEQADEIAESSATHMSMLAVNTAHAEDVDYSQVKYHGDLVIDIDNGAETDDAGNMLEGAFEKALMKSVVSAQKIMEFLEARCKADHIRIYASGKKGFHISIPWQLIHQRGRKTAVIGLPDVYKVMVEQIVTETGAEGVDLQLYAGKRGHLVRIPNKQRPEGTYKVQISYADLKLMTPEKYIEMCSMPRPALQLPDLDTCMGLRAMYDHARIVADQIRAKKVTQLGGIPDEMLEGFGTDNHPECIKRMLYWKHARQDKTYHSQARQLGIYIKRAQVPDTEQDNLIATFAEHGHSSTYATSDARRRHIQIQVMPYLKDEQFSCDAMRGCQDMSQGCTGCPVQAKVAENVSAETGIMETEEGYYMSSGDGAMRKLTNFTINVAEFHIPEDHVGRLTDWWDGGVITVMQGEISRGNHAVGTELFESAKEFKAVLKKCREAVVEVSDKDVDKLRDYILSTSKGKQGMRIVSSVGLRRMRYTPDDATTPVEDTFWIEDGWSCSSTGMVGSIKVLTPVPNVVRHGESVTSRVMTPEYEETLLNLMNCTNDWVVGLILGWVGASQVKEHIINIIHEFPLLHIYGVAGSGKTSLARLFTALGSANYHLESPQGAPNISPFPLRQMSWETTSIPRVLDEVNKPILQTGKWGPIREVLKACYQQSTMAYGTLVKPSAKASRTNIGSNRYRATAPMVFLSTSEVDEAELWERSIEVKLNKSAHHNPEFARHFTAVFQSPAAWDQLFAISKIIVGEALHIRPEDVLEMFNAHLQDMPEGFEMRPRKSFAYVFTGLSFLKKALSNGTDDRIAVRIDELTAAVTEWLDTEKARLIKRKSRTEVDNFFNVLISAADRVDFNGNHGLRPMVHYVRKDHLLYINPRTIYSEYRGECRNMGQYPMFSTYEQVKGAMQGMSYYLGEEKLPNERGVLRVWDKFDVNVLEGRGHDCGGFESI